MTAPAGGDERRPQEPDQPNQAREGGTPTPETGVGLGAGPPSSFEPEEDEPPAD